MTAARRIAAPILLLAIVLLAGAGCGASWRIRCR
jgi:hypothetical protein